VAVKTKMSTMITKAIPKTCDVFISYLNCYCIMQGATFQT
jgi:hypothetical protein